jgi:GGDEF domain-containing protein
MVARYGTERISEDLFAFLSRAAGVAFAVDARFLVTFASPAALDAWAAPDDPRGSSIWDVAPDLLGPSLAAALRRTMADRQAREVEEPSAATGRWHRSIVSPLAHGIAVHAHDIHDLHEARRLLELREASYQRTLEVSGLVAAGIDADLRYEWIFNPHDGLAPGDVIGRRDYEIADTPGNHELVALKREVLETGSGVQREIAFALDGGTRRYVVHGEPRHDGAGRVTGAITVAVDVTELRRAERAAATDALTGAANRRDIERQVRQELRRSDRYGTPFAILLLDVDRFKQINDTHGHLTGDDVLRQLVAAVRDELRAVDRIGRWGGRGVPRARPPR